MQLFFFLIRVKGFKGWDGTGIMLLHDEVRKLGRKKRIQGNILTDEVVLLDLIDGAGYLIS